MIPLACHILRLRLRQKVKGQELLSGHETRIGITLAAILDN